MRYVLNATADCANRFEDQGLSDGTPVTYHRIPVHDTWHQDISAHFEGAFRFISQALATGATVLVHCRAGISRSPTIVLAYLMSQRGMTLNAAYGAVKNVRPFISPNLDFMGQLVQFEQALKLESKAPAVSQHLLSPPPIARSPCGPAGAGAWRAAQGHGDGLRDVLHDSGRRDDSNETGFAAAASAPPLADTTNSPTPSLPGSKKAQAELQAELAPAPSDTESLLRSHKMSLPGAAKAGQAGFRLSLTLPQRTPNTEMFLWHPHSLGGRPLASPEAIQQAMRLPSVAEGDASRSASRRSSACSAHAVVSPCSPGATHSRSLQPPVPLLSPAPHVASLPSSPVMSSC